MLDRLEGSDHPTELHPLLRIRGGELDAGPRAAGGFGRAEGDTDAFDDGGGTLESYGRREGGRVKSNVRAASRAVDIAALGDRHPWRTGRDDERVVPVDQDERVRVRRAQDGPADPAHAAYARAVGEAGQQRSTRGVVAGLRDYVRRKHGGQERTGQ